MVQGRETKTGAWTNLTGAPRAKEALAFIQESDAPPPATLKETAAALVLTLHSWTWGHTNVLHDKTGPTYARTVICRQTTVSTGEAHLEWTAGREDDKYTLVHADRHGHRATEKKEPTPEPAATPPARRATRHWTLYRQLAHACTLAEHTIQPYTEAAYVERMLQDWTKYETEVLEGHTGPLDAISRATWDDVVPDGDIGGLRSKTSPNPTTRLETTVTAPSQTPARPTTAGPLRKASTSTPRTMTHASGTLLGFQRWSSTCTKMEPPEHTASPAFVLQCDNRHRTDTYPPVLRNPERPRNTNMGPPKKGTAQQPTKGPNPPTPPQLSNNSTSLSPHLRSQTTNNYPDGGTTQGARQRHGDYRRAPSIGRKSSQG